MASNSDERTSLLVSVLESACSSAADQYDDYARTFSGIDLKAQAAATIAGVALASVVAFLRPEHVTALNRTMGEVSLLVLLLPGALALVTVVLSVHTSRVTEVTVPFGATEQIQEAEDLAKIIAEEFSAQHVVNSLLSRIEHWKEALGDVEKVVQRKADRLLCTQMSLIATLFFLALLLSLLVFSAPL